MAGFIKKYLDAPYEWFRKARFFRPDDPQKYVPTALHRFSST